MRCQTYLGPRVRVLTQLISQYVDRRFLDLDLTCTQAFVLRYLSEHADEPVYPKDIEKRFHLTHPTVSGILQRLEAKEYITISTDRNDRRCKSLRLTDKALQCNREVRLLFAALENTLTDGMSEAEKSQLLRLLDQAAENLRKVEPKEESPQ